MTANYPPLPGRWADEGACRTAGVNMYPGKNHRDIAAAIDVCRRCPVRAECLAYALDVCDQHDHGIWGGVSQRERKRMRKHPQRRAA